MKSVYRNNLVLALGFLLLSLPARGHSADQIEKEVKGLCANLPFAMPEIRVPTFPGHRFTITDFGAVADGLTLNTNAITQAIQACVNAGGGIVDVPPGTWLTGPIRLESNVNLHLERGALLQFSNRIEDFPLIAGLDGKSKKYVITPPIAAYRATNIAITGNGVIDGAGEVWRYVKKYKMTEHQWKELVASGGVVSSNGQEWWPSQGAMDGQQYLRAIERSGRKPAVADYAHVREYLRPDMVQLVQCNGILIDGTTFQNSPRYHLRPVQSENVIIRGVKVLSPWYGQNTDGIDPVSCRNVIVYDATVDVGDDGICLKPGSIAASQEPGPACQNIVVANCVVYHAHGGFAIGSESFGGVRNVSVRNCLFIGTDVGLRFKSMRGRGGVVENVFVDGIQMRAITDDAILFDMYYGQTAEEREAAKAASSGPVPQFRDVSMKNIVCNGARQAVRIVGLPEMPVSNIMLENVDIRSVGGLSLTDADSITIRNCSITPERGPIMTMVQSRGVTVEGGSYKIPTGAFLSVSGEKSAGIRVRGIDSSGMSKPVELGPGAGQNAVRWEEGR